ncbi:MAG: hypothetical protein JM58_15655 [Peptococcaceae bacterium BICA1-8]|nr:MAG: hypothetical protein JM58_15655 [Peptococcaceae bacterium BICA1-8]
MKVLVLVKETFDTEVKIVLENEIISEKDVKYIINPYDEFAIEEAIKIKEKLGGEVILYSVGREEASATLKTGLAMGADQANIIKSNVKNSMTVSQLLSEAINKHDNEFDLILAGWVSIDDNNAQVPGRLSQLLNIPFVNVVTKVDVTGEIVLCEREGEGCQEIVEVRIPAIIAVQRGINEPRYPTMKNIMQAKRKNVNLLELTAPIDKVKVSYQFPEQKNKGEIIDGSNPEQAAKVLVDRLKESKIL